MIDGINIIPLKKIPDERGSVMHMLRSTDPHFTKFGEVYFSTVLPNAVKAWKRHKLMTQHFAVPYGKIKLVVYDNREESPTSGNLETIFIGEESYQLVIVPPKLWYGFQCVSDDTAILTNCADMPHDPSESEKMDLENDIIPFDWNAAEK